jgi:hypothetical protein
VVPQQGEFEPSHFPSEALLLKREYNAKPGGFWIFDSRFKAERGLGQADRGELLSPEEVRERMAKWLR